MRFPLRIRKISGYTFGQKTFYSNFHLGVDYAASDGEAIFAPSNGEIIWQGFGKEGGNTIHFRDINGNIIRFLHLKSFNGQPRKVKEGDIIGFCDNTGLSKGPHLHLDISKRKLDIKNRSNFINPEVYFEEEDMPNLKEIFKGMKVGKFPNNPTQWVAIPNPEIWNQINGGKTDEVWFENAETIKFKNKPEIYIHIPNEEMWQRLNGKRIDKELDIVERNVVEELEKKIQDNAFHYASNLSLLQKENEALKEEIKNLKEENEKLKQKFWQEFWQWLKGIFKKEKW